MIAGRRGVGHVTGKRPARWFGARGGSATPRAFVTGPTHARDVSTRVFHLFHNDSFDMRVSMTTTRVTEAPRVLYCTDTYLPQVNGVSIVTALSVDGLRARGWTCGVIAPRYPDEARGR